MRQGQPVVLLLSVLTRFKSLIGLETKSSGISSPEDWLFEAFGAQPSAAGIAVSPRNAIKCAPVRAAVAAISEPISTLPLHLYKRTANGKERATSHPISKLLLDAVSDHESASTFRELLTSDALLHHGGYAWIARNGEGVPVSLHRFDPATVTVKVDPYEGPTYEVAQQDGSKRIIPREDILHLRSPSLSGHGLVHDARDVIGLALVLERHANKLFANGAKPSGVLSLKNVNTAEGIAKVKAAWIAAHGGDKSGSTAVLPSDAEWQSLMMTSVDAQFLELRKFSIEEIARVFRVPPILLFEYGRATWGNSESMRQDFLDFSLMRWINAWENEIALKLLTPDERAAYVVEFLTDNFARADLVKRTEAYTKAVGGPWMLANEARAAENRPAIPNGDKLLPPANASGVNVSAAA
jgi:HK97 family phage portal protein